MEIKLIGYGSYMYENYEIGINKEGICYLRYPHGDWELAGW